MEDVTFGIAEIGRKPRGLSLFIAFYFIVLENVLQINAALSLLTLSFEVFLKLSLKAYYYFLSA